MRSSLALGITHRQQQALSPRLQRAVRLLQLSSLDFAQEVQEVLGKNPFLEADESDAEAVADEAALEKNFEQGFEQGFEKDFEAGVEGGAETSFAGEPAADMLAEAFSQSDDSASADQDGERENWQADGQSSNRRNDDSDVNLMDMRATEESLADYLLRQLHVMPLSPRDLALAEAIVGSLDDDGYLRFKLSELIEVTNLDPPPDEEELNIALLHVQSLDPPGIGARSVQECLFRQLPAIGCGEQRELARLIVAEHLDALAAKDISGLARTLARKPAEIQSVIECIRRLDPRPGWRFGSWQAQYVTPDVIVKKVRGNWTATLNPAIVPKVRLHQVYAEMFRRTRCAQNSELAGYLQEARWTVSNIEQRFATILSVSQAIVSRQRHFLEFGPLAMKPLGLRGIADEVGLHESTVSRVTNNKFMATPLGVFELKYFFSRAMATVSGGECSGTAIRGLISDMIAAEHHDSPLSDAEIARQLARQGLVVARRTVTKYRQLLRIESFERRRQHA